RDLTVTGVQTCALPICLCRLFQRDPLAIAPLGLDQERAQSAHGQSFVSQDHDRARSILQFPEVAWPCIVSKKLLSLGAQDRRWRSEERRVGKECRYERA